ncbi:hypothetical protein Dhaf_1456 [Desulfitobacterium hafniense DCB-2]|uniref:Uncharacterized protein n=1 Tax=Desulfitobacterium hafniense (strain DSM 10664 / DCB-2) TaxID=272564 RepID=B8FNY4_DESHD|nr:hypothetical protein Dhaf_1456 [Desulfitobacterium hafniense DCB-2]
MNRIKMFLRDYLEDIFVFLGLLLIILASLMINIILGIYAAGVILFLLGVYFIRFPIRKGR